ncbi:head-tail connector protein [Streptomyces lavendulocolor]|uniref:head-tail connector protein n=1 Tax=Streptomyces lavendulocolor TaxID=67316 RepID=UPI0033FB72B8
MPFDLGATARLTAECRDPGGTLTTASTAVCTITLPDGTSATPAVTVTGEGQYRADYPTVQAGRHLVRWVFTGPAHAYTDTFDVAEAAPLGLFSLAEAKRHLNLTDTTQDDEVRAWVDTATEAVEWFVGPVVPRTVTEDHRFAHASSIVLRQTPVLEVATVEPILTGGTSYLPADLTPPAASGVVQLLSGGILTGPLRVTYTAGRRVVPPSIRSAALIILQHLWRTQQRPSRPQYGTGDFDVTEPIPGLGYAIPHRAAQLLSPHQLPPGVA